MAKAADPGNSVVIHKRAIALMRPRRTVLVVILRGVRHVLPAVPPGYQAELDEG